MRVSEANKVNELDYTERLRLIPFSKGSKVIYRFSARNANLTSVKGQKRKDHYVLIRSNLCILYFVVNLFLYEHKTMRFDLIETQ